MSKSVTKGPTELQLLEEAMVERYGVLPRVESNAQLYTKDLYQIQHIVESHMDWHVKRYGGHRWEVRNGVKDKTYYGETLAIALCRALLEIK